jgi:hypothetical protein
MSEDDKKQIEEAKKAVTSLILKADANHNSDGSEAMKFAQAATNAANALETLLHLPEL